MIARVLLFFLIFLSIFFGIYWTVFCTNFVTRERLVEMLKVGAIALMSLFSALLLLGFIINADKLS